MGCEERGGQEGSGEEIRGEERWVGRTEGGERESNTLTFSLLSITLPSTVSLPGGLSVCINE